MFGICRLAKSFYIPKSTATQYNFDPIFMGFGSRVYDSSEAKNRVSNQEFEAFRAEMISTGGSDLSTAKCMLYIMCVTLPLAFAIFIMRIAMLIAKKSLPLYATIICIVVIIIPNIVVSCARRRYVRSAYNMINTVVEKKNRSYFYAKGVAFKINPSLKYMSVTFHKKVVQEV